MHPVLPSTGGFMGRIQHTFRHPFHHFTNSICGEVPACPKDWLLYLPLRTNIAGKVRTDEVVRFVQGLKHVTVARDYKFMCSDPGQEMIQKDIRELGLNRVVVASCSPRCMRRLPVRLQRAGLNPFLFQMAASASIVPG